MKKSVLGVFVELISGCLYGAFIGFFLYLFLHAVLSKLGFGDTYESSLYILGGTCIPLWGIMKSWIAWENYKLENAHQEYEDYKESQKEPRQ